MALAELFELARAANKAHDANDKARIKAQMPDAGELLGLLQQEPAAWFALVPVADDVPATGEIEAQLAERADARLNKQWAESDRIRDELKERSEQRSAGIACVSTGRYRRSQYVYTTTTYQQSARQPS